MPTKKTFFNCAMSIVWLDSIFFCIVGERFSALFEILKLRITRRGRREGAPYRLPAKARMLFYCSVEALQQKILFRVLLKGQEFSIYPLAGFVDANQ